jgi:hypothetical protein
MVNNNKFSNAEKDFLKRLKKVLYLLIISLGFIFLIPLFIIYSEIRESNSVEIIPEKTDGHNSGSGKTLLLTSDSLFKTQNVDSAILADGKGVELVRANCTPCHSARLIVQNRATREGWLSMIRWMQQTQNLWDLGPNEEIILDYLSTYYPVEEKGRRENLADIEWYVLDN